MFCLNHGFAEEGEAVSLLDGSDKKEQLLSDEQKHHIINMDETKFSLAVMEELAAGLLMLTWWGVLCTQGQLRTNQAALVF